MKTLFLCVDRDDDLGRKGNVETPIVGRRRLVDAATSLGLADPEDSDTNAILSTVHLYDKELKNSKGERQLECAAIAGHRNVGMRSDRILAQQIDEVMAITQATEIVLITDGAEDEQILPILQARAPVAHIHRSIVKQAPRLEGAWYVLQRMLDDDKLAKRYVLPLGLVLLVWGIAFLFGLSGIATGLTLGILGGWFVVHSMRWEDRVSNFFHDFAEGMRTGKVSAVANVAMLLIFLIGIGISVDRSSLELGWTIAGLRFADAFLIFLIGGLLTRTLGGLIDETAREGRVSLRFWTRAFTLVAFGFIASVFLDFAVIQFDPAQSFSQVESTGMIIRLILGVGIMASGIILRRYVNTLFAKQRDGTPRIKGPSE